MCQKFSVSLFRKSNSKFCTLVNFELVIISGQNIFLHIKNGDILVTDGRKDESTNAGHFIGPFSLLRRGTKKRSFKTRPLLPLKYITQQKRFNSPLDEDRLYLVEVSLPHDDEQKMSNNCQMSKHNESIHPVVE